MSDQEATPSYTIVTTNVPLRVALIGATEESLSCKGVSLTELIVKAFVELANIGNNFSILFHHITVLEKNEELHFLCGSERYAGGTLNMTIRQVPGPILVRDDEIATPLRELLRSGRDPDVS